MINLLYIIIQVFVIIFIAPLINGIIKKVKAFTQKRTGAPLLQMYFDLYKLLKKESVVSDVSSWIFMVTPYIVFCTAVLAAVFVPVTTKLMPTWFFGDIITMVCILALGRFFMMLSGIDTASTFGGMGASREAMISSLIEPAVLVSVFTIGLVSKSTSVFKIMSVMNSANIHLVQPVFIMVFLSIFIIIIAETSRIPVDDPATHLELTMVHEAMILEYSGRNLALMELGTSVKQLVFITLLVNVFMPFDRFIHLPWIAAVIISLIIYFIKVMLITIIIALVEVNTVKLRLLSIPNLAVLSFMLSFFGFLQYFVFGR